MVKSFKTIVFLVRPVNLLLVVFASMLGSILARIGGVEPVGLNAPLAALSAALISAGGYAINDAIDCEEDMVNRPTRPVASGMLLPGQAVAISVVLFSVGGLAGWFISIYNGLIAVAVIALLVLYANKAKSWPLAGNILVAICASLPFVYGALAAGNIVKGILPFMLALPIHLAREILKDSEDVEGDRTAGITTYAVVKSPEQAIRMAGFVMFIGAAIIIMPYFMKLAGILYIALAGSFVALPMAYIAGGAMAYPAKLKSGKIQRILKILMVPGMIAIVLGDLIK